MQIQYNKRNSTMSRDFEIGKNILFRDWRGGMKDGTIKKFIGNALLLIESNGKTIKKHKNQIWKNLYFKGSLHNSNTENGMPPSDQKGFTHNMSPRKVERPGNLKTSDSQHGRYPNRIT